MKQLQKLELDEHVIKLLNHISDKHFGLSTVNLPNRFGIKANSKSRYRILPSGFQNLRPFKLHICNCLLQLY